MNRRILREQVFWGSFTTHNKAVRFCKKNATPKKRVCFSKCSKNRDPTKKLCGVKWIERFWENKYLGKFHSTQQSSAILQKNATPTKNRVGFTKKSCGVNNNHRTLRTYVVLWTEKNLSFQQIEEDRTTNLRVVFALQNFPKYLTLPQKIVWLNKIRTILKAGILKRVLHQKIRKFS